MRTRRRRAGFKTNDVVALVLTALTIVLVLLKYREYALSGLQYGEPGDLSGQLGNGRAREWLDPPPPPPRDYDLVVEVAEETEPTGRKKWTSARTRAKSRIDPSVLPPLDGLPVYLPDQKLKDEVFVTKESYEKLLAQFKTDRNFLQSKRSFPEGSDLLSAYNLTTCAVVGNSGGLLNGTFGGAIDSHATVVRINQAMTNRRYHKHVGSKTTFRLINTRWTNK